jgi:hypothetical protein
MCIIILWTYIFNSHSIVLWVSCFLFPFSKTLHFKDLSTSLCVHLVHSSNCCIKYSAHRPQCTLSIFSAADSQPTNALWWLSIFSLRMWGWDFSGICHWAREWWVLGYASPNWPPVPECSLAELSCTSLHFHQYCLQVPLTSPTPSIIQLSNFTGLLQSRDSIVH